MTVSNKTSHTLVNKWKTKTNKAIEIGTDISMMTLDTLLQCSMSTETNCQLHE